MAAFRRRVARLLLSLSVVALVGATAGGALSAAHTRQAGPQKGGTLRVGLLEDILNLDPYSRALNQYSITKVIYEPLIEYTAGFKPEPALATKWSMNRSLTAVTVQLRHGVTFHSGAPFNSAAVVANFNRARNPATGQHMYFFTSVVKDAVATGPYTVRLDLNSATPVPLILDTLQSLPMVDPGYFTKLSNSASGTGPYELQNWTPGQSITLVPNEKWWGGKTPGLLGEAGAPYLDKLVLDIFSSSASAAAALQSGQIDMIEDVNPANVPQLKKSGFKIVAGPPASLVLDWHLNAEKAPFSNQTFRRAMNYALDRAAIIKATRAGYGTPVATPFFTHDPAYDKKLLKVYAYNMNKVGAILKKSGVSDTSFSIMVTPIYPDTVQTAEIIQQEFKQIGVNVTIDQYDSATWVKNLVAGNFESTLTYDSGSQHFPSQITFGSAWRTSNNALFGNNVPAIYLNAITADQHALTKTAQQKALRQLEEAALVMSSSPVIASRPPLFALSPKVQGFAMTVDAMPLYGKVWLR